jgi:hypothetical protein
MRGTEQKPVCCGKFRSDERKDRKRPVFQGREIMAKTDDELERKYGWAADPTEACLTLISILKNPEGGNPIDKLRSIALELGVNYDEDVVFSEDDRQARERSRRLALKRGAVELLESDPPRGRHLMEGRSRRVDLSGDVHPWFGVRLFEDRDRSRRQTCKTSLPDFADGEEGRKQRLAFKRGV